MVVHAWAFGDGVTAITGLMILLVVGVSGTFRALVQMFPGDIVMMSFPFPPIFQNIPYDATVVQRWSIAHDDAMIASV